jgi:hypothetical protein
MNRRIAFRATLALVIVVIATFSTVRARQAWGEQQARSSFDAARTQVAAELSRAARDGLLPDELVRLVNAKARLDAVRSPSSSILWGSDESFYTRRAAAYRSLLVRIDRKVAAVTAITRDQASAALAGLAAAIGRARGYNLDVSIGSTELAQSRVSFEAARTPEDYRLLTGTVHAGTGSEQAATAARAKAVAAVVNGAGGSLDGVVQLADSQATQAQTELSLVTLFSKQAKPLVASLSALSGAVHAQKIAYKAAIQEASLGDLLNTVNSLMTKAVPAKVVLVSTEDQWAHMYENGREVYNTPVTTGGPELPTDHGIFHIYEKLSPFTFHSPWPPDSPYYYPPTPVSYWMPFDGGEGLHDASWRSYFGPGSNFAPTDLGTGNYILGTHGCVNLPFDAATFVWNWAPLGTTVVVV